MGDKDTQTMIMKLAQLNKQLKKANNNYKKDDIESIILTCPHGCQQHVSQ
jgi:hypothetical protein